MTLIGLLASDAMKVTWLELVENLTGNVQGTLYRVNITIQYSIRLDYLPILIREVANVTPIIIQSSVNMTNFNSADFYYLIYYENNETIMRSIDALSSVRVNELTVS